MTNLVIRIDGFHGHCVASDRVYARGLIWPKSSRIFPTHAVLPASCTRRPAGQSLQPLRQLSLLYSLLEMPLNPFAREYVPNIGKQTSLLNVNSSSAALGTSQVPNSPALAQTKPNTQPVGSARCPTPAAEALEDEELQFEDVFEVEVVPSPPSPRSHLSAASPGGLSMVCIPSFPVVHRVLLVVVRLFAWPHTRFL